MESEVGANVYCIDPILNLLYKLTDHCSIFQVEDFAKGKAAEIALNMN